METVPDLAGFVAQLDRQLKDQVCVVKLIRGQDHVGMARMEVEDVYIDDKTPGSTVLRVVGRHTDGEDHAMLGLPLGSPSGQVSAARDDDHVALQAGEFHMVIHPGSQAFPS